jgi:hypothetical protein
MDTKSKLFFISFLLPGSKRTTLFSLDIAGLTVLGMVYLLSLEELVKRGIFSIIGVVENLRVCPKGEHPGSPLLFEKK